MFKIAIYVFAGFSMFSSVVQAGVKQGVGTVDWKQNQSEIYQLEAEAAYQAAYAEGLNNTIALVTLIDQFLAVGADAADFYIVPLSGGILPEGTGAMVYDAGKVVGSFVQGNQEIKEDSFNDVVLSTSEAAVNKIYFNPKIGKYQDAVELTGNVIGGVSDAMDAMESGDAIIELAN